MDPRDDDTEDTELLEELAAAAEEEAAGALVDLDVVLDRFGKPAGIADVAATVATRLASPDARARLEAAAASSRARARAIVSGAIVDSQFLTKRVTI